MSLNTTHLNAAVEAAKIFLNEDYVENTSNGPHFNRAHLKKLSAPDRKAYYNLLDMVEKATLPDLKNCVSSIPKELKTRLEDLSDAMHQDLVIKNDESPAWWKWPFVKIAKLIHSLAIGILNIFGRVSTEKLFDKVEAYRRDYLEAEKKLKELIGVDGNRGKIDQAYDAHKAALDKFENFISDEYNPNFELIRVINRISREAPSDAMSDTRGLENIKWDAFDRWSTDSDDDAKRQIRDALDVKSFKEVVAGIIESEPQNDELNELLAVAKSDDYSEEAVREIFKRFKGEVIDLNNQLVKRGDQLHKEELGAWAKCQKRDHKADLLRQKYKLEV